MSVEIARRKVGNLFRELFGRNVKVEEGEPIATSSNEPSWIAAYGAGEGKLAGVCLCDLGFAANAGAALCLIPASTAKQSVSARKLEDVLFENLKEILNVCCQLFIESGIARVTLKSVLPAAQPSAEDVKQLLDKPHQRVDMKVSIEGYGDGKLSFLT